MSAQDLKDLFAAEREGCVFVVFRDGEERQHIVKLTGDRDRLTLGRRPENDIVLEWDAETSRVHAELARVGGEWTVSDEGLSQNGTWVGTERVAGRRRLRDGDVIRLGQTLVTFRDPGGCAEDETAIPAAGPAGAGVTPAQRRVLEALCRPLLEAPGYATPATNQDIADELVISTESVRSHLRALFRSFEIDDLPQNQKRGALADQAVRLGLVRR